MSWGNGIFQRTNGQFSGATVWQDDESAGFGIEWRRQDAHDQDIANGVDQCLNKNGENPMLADLAMGTFKFTDLRDPVLNGDILTVGFADGRYMQTDGGVAPSADISMNDHKITGLANGTADSDMAAKGQVAFNIEWAFISASGTSTPSVIASSGGVGVNNVSNQITNVTWANSASTVDDQAFFFTSCTNLAPIYGRFANESPPVGWRTVNSVYVLQDQPSGAGIAQRDFVIIRTWG